MAGNQKDTRFFVFLGLMPRFCGRLLVPAGAEVFASLQVINHLGGGFTYFFIFSPIWGDDPKID